MTKQEMVKDPLFRELCTEISRKYYVCLDTLLDDYIKSLQSEWEILSLKNKDNKIISPILDNYIYGDIHSVKYKGETFTVGDCIQLFSDDKISIGNSKLKSFLVYENEMYCNSEAGYSYHIKNVQKLSAIFVTNGDNEPIFEGNKVYFNLKGEAFIRDMDCDGLTRQYDGTTYFKSREKALQWLRENAQVLSLKEYTTLPSHEIRRLVIERTET